MNPTALAAAVAVASVIFWLIALVTLNRGPDRIQLATLCLFFCLIGYGLSVVGAAERGGLSAYMVLLGAYMLVVYIAMVSVVSEFDGLMFKYRDGRTLSLRYRG